MVSDYASQSLPHFLEGWGIKEYLYAKSWGLQKRQMPQVGVWFY